MAGEERSMNSAWSREQDRAFENALAAHAEDWERIAAAVEGKSAEEVKRHYEILVEDLENIEAGRVPLPSMWEDDVGSSRRGGTRGRRSGGRGLHGQKRSIEAVSGGASSSTVRH